MTMNQLHTWANNIQIIDRSDDLTESDPLYAFALDELLGKQAHATGNSFCHIWRHPNAFIIGQKDSRLPNALQAMELLEMLNVETAIRNSGGAAVPLDLGVVNLSLIFPKPLYVNERFRQDFEKMYQLLQSALSFAGASIDKGEIKGAFCPGDYDLSIAGQKFCGIAQRRQIHSYSIQAFIIVSGSGRARVNLVQQFYEIAAKGASAADFPQVTEESTASLQELIQLDDNAVNQFVTSIKQTLTSYSQQQVVSSNDHHSNIVLPDPETVRALADRLRKRYTIAARNDS